MIAFFVDGIPKAQPRPRRSKNGGVYTPPVADAWKQELVLQARRHRPVEPFSGPLSVAIDFFLPRPARYSRKKDPSGPMWADVKPDRDNLEKAVLDALTDDGWWGDDAQVVAGEVRKLYHAKDGRPGARIAVFHLFEFST